MFTGETDRGKYAWLHDPAPHPLDARPQDLREFLGLSENPATVPSSSREGDRKRENAKELVRRALNLVSSEGRNTAGFWLATQLRDNQYSKETAREVMLTYRSRCPEMNSKGAPEEYTEREVEATLNQVYDHPARGPWVKQNSKVVEMGNALAEVQQESEEKDEQGEDEHFRLTELGVFHLHHKKDKNGNFSAGHRQGLLAAGGCRVCARPQLGGMGAPGQMARRR